MANEVVEIKNSWSLLSFAAAHGKMKVGEFQNKKTQEIFKSCVFVAPDDTKCFVHFAQKLGVLTPEEISKRKYSLQVVQLQNDSFILCQNNWQDVDL